MVGYSSPKTRVLVVEDDTALNDAYKIILQSAGHEVMTAGDGKEALEQLKKKGAVDIILLDLRMPVMDGIGFLKQFQPTTHPETDVVVFSNYDAHKDIDEAYQLGVQRYVLKARTAPRDLLHLINTIVGERATSLIDSPTTQSA